VQLLLDAQGGFLYFSSKVPSVSAARFNFVADERVGVKIILSSARSLSVAYVFHHLSNGFEAKDNPGVDSQMIYAGFTFNLPKRFPVHRNSALGPCFSFLRMVWFHAAADMALC
jgi:hypothetical protein